MDEVLYSRVIHNDLEGVRKLLLDGAKPKPRLLSHACKAPNTLESADVFDERLARVVQLLLDSGEFSHVDNPDGGSDESPLYFAIYSGRLRVARCLLKAGADINYRGGLGESVLDTALHGGLEAVRFVLAQADFDAAANVFMCALRNKSATVFHSAVTSTVDSVVIDALMEHAEVAAMLDHAEHLVDGNTALHTAFQRGNWPAVRTLLRHGAKVHLVNKKGLVAIEVEQAEWAHHPGPVPDDIVEMVSKARASVGKTIKAAGRQPKNIAKRKREAPTEESK